MGHEYNNKRMIIKITHSRELLLTVEIIKNYTLTAKL